MGRESSPRQPLPRSSKKVRILLIAVRESLRQRLLGSLRQHHDVSIVDDDVRDREFAARATAGFDTLVCGLPVQGGDPLEAIDRASRGVYNAITTAASVRRFVLLSSLRPFERYPLDHAVTEYWAPRPSTHPDDLVPFIAEAVVREAAHTLPLKAICLRLGPIVDDDQASDARAVHVADVVQAVERALEFEAPPGEVANGWWVFHIVGAGRTRFPLGMARSDRRASADVAGLGYTPTHDVSGSAPLTPTTLETPLRFTDRPSG